MSDGPQFPRPPYVPPVPPSPGGGMRNGPAWEGPGEFFQRYVDTVKPALTDPKSFFSTMRVSGGLQAPVTFAVIGLAVSAIASAFYSSVGPFGFGYGFPGSVEVGGGFVSILLMTLILGVCGLFIGAAIFHLALSLLGAARLPFEATLRVVAYAAGSTSLLGLVPVCGSIVGGIYAIVLYIIGLQQVHECDTAKAAIAVLAPAVVCCVLFVLAWGTVMALIFGAAAAGAMQ